MKGKLPMKVLVLGYGSAGSRHAKLLTELGATVSVYDPNPEAPVHRKLYYRRGFFADEEREAWRWGPDAVVVASPAEHHVTGVLAAVAAGVPFFVEKPACVDADVQTRLLRQVDERYSLVKQVGYQLRSHPGCRALRDAVLAGMVGHPLSARFCTGSDVRQWGGSSYSDALLECSHELDAALWVLGPGEVACAARGVATWEVALRHERDVLSAVHLSTEEPVYRRRWEVVGTEGVAAWDAPECLTTLERPGGGVEVLWRGTDMVDANMEAYRAQLAAFLSAVSGEAGSPPCALADGLAVVGVVRAARELAAGDGVAGVLRGGVAGVVREAPGTA